MSLILDALQRAEQESRGQAAPAEGQAGVRAAVAPQRLARYWFGGCMALLLGAVIVALVLRPQPGPGPGAPASVTPPPVLPAVSPGFVQAAESGPEPASATLRGQSPEVDDLDDLLPPRAATARPARGSGESGTDPPATARRPEQAKAVVAVADGPTPLVDMPTRYRANFPPIKVDVHVYDEQPKRRFVLVNLRRYREGDRLAEGPMIREIRPSALVFEFRGERVLYDLSR